MQNNCSGNNRKYGLEAHKKRRNRRFCILLRYNLKGISYTAGKYARVQNRQPAVQNRINLRFLKDKHSDNANRTGHKELYAGHLHAVNLRCKIVDDQNMYGKSHRAKQYKRIAELQLK